MPTRRTLLTTAAVLSGHAFAAPPTCAWTPGDASCGNFEFGGKWAGAVQAVDECPPGSSVIHDIKTCKEAAESAGFMFDDETAVEGADCHWCGGCNPAHFRLSTNHGAFAKWVCKLNSAPTPAAAAKSAAAAPTGTKWPDCQMKNTVIRNAGQALFADLQGYGATIGCFLDDCLVSDKFVVNEFDSCAKVCRSMPGCEYWTWGTEEGEQKCWFRTGSDGKEGGEGWVSGSKSCYPPGSQLLVMGNDECWSTGFGYENCCDPKYGPNGNAQCWDGVYNFDRCCFPRDEL